MVASTLRANFALRSIVILGPLLTLAVVLPAVAASQFSQANISDRTQRATPILASVVGTTDTYKGGGYTLLVRYSINQKDYISEVTDYTDFHGKPPSREYVVVNPKNPRHAEYPGSAEYTRGAALTAAIGGSIAVIVTLIVLFKLVIYWRRRGFSV